MSTGFAVWAADKRRSLEERFGIQLLIEQTLGVWRHKHGVTVEYNYEAKRLREKERSLNPAYEPEFSATDAGRVEEILAGVKSLSFTQWNDRPLRNLSFLQFCPALESLTAYRTEIRDWTPLLALPGLTDLRLSDHVARDFRPLARLTGLRTLDITAHAPWPDMTGFEQLSALEEFEFMGNVLALGVIPHLAGLRRAKFHQLGDFHVPVRRISDLPHMPELRRFHLENTWQLDGLERSPLLVNLEVFGYFEDLAPLAALKKLTHLFVSGGDYNSLAPVAHLPELRRLILRRENASDLSLLAETPRLHELRVELCLVQREEVAVLNSTLAPWSEEFAMEPPRALKPLRLVLRDDADDPKGDSTAAPRDWGDDHAMAGSEARWFARQINLRLTMLLGQGWGRVEDRLCDSPGYDRITIGRRADIDRLPEIVQCLRQLIATARHPWTFLLVVNSLAEYERDMDEIDDDDDEEEFDAEREREEWEDQREQERERREYLEREYRYRLRQEQGMPTKPEEFAPPSKSAEEATAGADEDDEGPSPYELGTELHLYATLTEAACYVQLRDRGLAELLLETKAEE